jgi:putative ABC transport system ATP-binding protein
LEGVNKKYNHRGGLVMALRDVNLEVLCGEFLGVVGPSGSGKSTLLLTLGGMLSPTTGRIVLDGRSLYDLSSGERALVRRDRIGFLFQTFNLVPYLSALENVQMPLLLAGLDRRAQVSRAEELLRQMGLDDRMGHKPSELSIGQQQRVALARMLANDPDIVLADEPTGNLDPETTTRVVDSLYDLNAAGKTVVMVTHNHASVSKADRTLWLSEGRVSAEKASFDQPEY